MSTDRSRVVLASVAALVGATPVLPHAERPAAAWQASGTLQAPVARQRLRASLLAPATGAVWRGRPRRVRALLCF